MSLLNNVRNLVINLLGCFVTVIFLFGDFTTEEDQFFFATEGPQSQFLAHSKVGYHGSSYLGSLLNILSGTGRHFIENNFIS